MEKTRRSDGKTPFAEALEGVQGLIEALDRPAAVIGGVAVIAYGFPRATMDIDVALVADPSEAESVLAVGKRLGFRARIPDAATFARENLVLLLEHSRTGTLVDLSFALQEFERTAAEEAQLRTVDSVSVRVTTLTALLIYKLVAGRPQDLIDAQRLLQRGEPFDRARVEQTLAELDALLESDRLSEFRRLVAAYGQK